MQQRIQRLLEFHFVRFCIVGVSGFIVNAVALELLDKNLSSPFVAQLIAGEIALFSNFFFHNKWTYKANHVRKTMTKLLVQFHLSSWTGIVISATLVTIGVKELHLEAVAALACSSVVVLFWNFGWSRLVIWRKPEPHKQESESV